VIDRSNPLSLLITPGTSTSQNFSQTRPEILESIIDAVNDGVSMIQIREKKLTGRQLFELVVAAVPATAGTNVKLLVSERFDIALAAGASGVHLPSGSIPVDAVRACVPQSFVIGVSTHTFEEVTDTKRRGADYVVFGPVFPTPGKGKPKGLEELSRLCTAMAPFPIFGLGGIDSGNYREVIAAGAAGIAAIRSLNDKGSREAILSGLKGILPKD
jgi:thiamine-phosphate pyrophosphorylase